MALRIVAFVVGAMSSPLVQLLDGAIEHLGNGHGPAVLGGVGAAEALDEEIGDGRRIGRARGPPRRGPVPVRGWSCSSCSFCAVIWVF